MKNIYLFRQQVMRKYNESSLEYNAFAKTRPYDLNTGESGIKLEQIMLGCEMFFLEYLNSMV
jgi:hypothetical protein